MILYRFCNLSLSYREIDIKDGVSLDNLLPEVFYYVNCQNYEFDIIQLYHLTPSLHLKLLDWNKNELEIKKKRFKWNQPKSSGFPTSLKPLMACLSWGWPFVNFRMALSKCLEKNYKFVFLGVEWFWTILDISTCLPNFQIFNRAASRL